MSDAERAIAALDALLTASHESGGSLTPKLARSMLRLARRYPEIIERVVAAESAVCAATAADRKLTPAEAAELLRCAVELEIGLAAAGGV